MNRSMIELMDSGVKLTMDQWLSIGIKTQMDMIMNMISIMIPDI